MIEEILKTVGLTAFVPIFQEQRMDVDRFEKLYKRGCVDMLVEDLKIHESFIETIHKEITRQNAKLTPQSKTNQMKFQGYYGRNNRVQKLMQQNTRPSTVSAKQHSALSSVGNSGMQSAAAKHPIADVKVQEFKQQPVVETKEEPMPSQKPLIAVQ